MQTTERAKQTPGEDLSPPQSQEAERSVLGALMLDSRSWDRVSDRLTELDFYCNEHRLIYRTIAVLSRRSGAFDVLTVIEALKAAQELEAVGGEVYLYELVQNTPTAANITAYADIVAERAILRALMEAGTDITSSVLQPAACHDVRELLNQAESRIFRIAEQREKGSGPVPVSTLLTQATNRIDTLHRAGQSITGLATGFNDFDALTSGLQLSDMIIVAGRPSMGKTVLAMNIVENAAIKEKQVVLVFSLEMSAESLTIRLLSSLGRIDQHRIRTGQLNDDDWPRIASSVKILSDSRLFIDDTPALAPAELRSRARRVAREQGGLGLVVVDYIQLMQVPGNKENRATEVSEISRALKAIAKELNAPVVALSQLNRSLESRADRRPIMSDLRESGSLEQDADVILFIYRDEIYNEDSPDKGLAEIIVRKHRNGPVGTFRLTFLGQYTRFENYSSALETLE